MYWRKIRISGLLAGMSLAFLVLAACSVTPVRSGLTETEQASLTPEQQLFVAEADYLVNKADFVAYAEQPRCTETLVVGCHDPAVVAEIRGLDKQVREAFSIARVAAGTAEFSVKAEFARSLLARFAAQVAVLTLKGG